MQNDNPFIEVTSTMHGIRSGRTMGTQLGPTPMTTVSLECCETSLTEYCLTSYHCFTTIPAANTYLGSGTMTRPQLHGKQSLGSGLEPSIVTLQNYSGVKLNIIQQIKVHITRTGFSSIDVVVQVQKDARAIRIRHWNWFLAKVWL